MHRQHNPRPVPVDPQTVDFLAGEIQQGIAVSLRGLNGTADWSRFPPARMAFPEAVPFVKGGHPQNVVVEVRVADHAAPVGFFVHGEAHTSDDPRGLSHAILYINPRVAPRDMRAQANKDALRPAIVAMLEHELRHVAQFRRRPAPGRDQAVHTIQELNRQAAAGLPENRRVRDAAWHAYINDPRELEARLGDVVREVRERRPSVETIAELVRLGGGDYVGQPNQVAVERVLAQSPAWNQIEATLTPPNRRRVLRAVYQELRDILERAVPPDDEDDRQDNPRKPAYAPSEREQCLPAVVDKGLLRWAGSLIGANDVLIWLDGEGTKGTPRVRIAFRAPAARIENVYKAGMLPNRNLWLEISLQKAMGIAVTTDRSSGRVYDIDSEVGRTLDDDEAHFATVLEAVETVAQHLLAPCFGKEPVVTAVFLPNEGAILAPHYSAKRKAWMPAGSPPPTVNVTIQVEDDAGSRSPLVVKGVDLCRFYSHIEGCGPDIVALDEPTERPAWEVSEEHDQLLRKARQMTIDTSPEESAAVQRRLRELERELDQAKAASPIYKGSARGKATKRASGSFLVVHATIPTPESAKAVAACGGWLFPSLAVGMLPSVSFGPLVLVASVELVLQALKPYRTSRALPINVYDTDTWTIKSGNLPDAAKVLYDQLTGRHEESIYGMYGAHSMGGPHQWVLGAPTSLSSLSNEFNVSLITSTKALSGELRLRAKVWSSGTAKEILDRYGMTRHRYPYLEGKVNGMLAPSCFRLAVCPTSWKKQSRAYMKATGITAPLIEVPDPPGMRTPPEWSLHHVDDEGDTLAFSRVVADAIVAYARQHGLTRGYEIA